MELLPLETVSQLGQDIIMASNSFKNGVQEKLQCSENNYEQLRLHCDSHAKVLGALI